jgi:hypothetical protein
MNTNLRKLNLQFEQLIQTLEIDMQSSATLDLKAYLELSQLIVRIDKITLLMLSDITNERVLN